jgi:hypothetical protein
VGEYLATKTTLNAKNLESLGAERLAGLLMEMSTGNAALKRRLRLALASAGSSGEVANEVRKRIAAITRSQSFVDWRGVKSLADDLDAQRRAIVESVAKANLSEALELLWRFMAAAPAIFERCDDSSGRVVGVFHDACRDLGDVAAKAKVDPTALANRAYDARLANGYGQFDELIQILAPALGQTGLEHLKQRMIDLLNRPVIRPAEQDRVNTAWSSAGPVYADEIAERLRVSRVRLALQEIADVQGDVDAYIAQYEEEARRMPRITAEIARRLLSAGRVEEAWRTIEATEHRRAGAGRDWPEFDWQDVRIDVLEALGRGDEAQAARWECFERSLSGSHLRAYLNRLPDFDDLDAEQRALDYAQRSNHLLQALSFLIVWPALDRASNLVLQRSGELDGDHYELLTPAADELAAKFPLAATVVLRSMIDFSLTKNRSGRYKHAARHLLDCSSLASRIEDFGIFEPHDAYEARLRRMHGRKSSFWSLVD